MNSDNRCIELYETNVKDEKDMIGRFVDLDEDYNFVIDYDDLEKKFSRNISKLEVRVLGKFHLLSIAEVCNKAKKIFLNLQNNYSSPAVIDNLVFNKVNKVRMLGGIIKVMFVGNDTTIDSLDMNLCNIETLITNKIYELKLNSCSISEFILNVNGSSQVISDVYTKNIIIDGSELKKIMIINTIESLNIIKSKIDELVILNAKISFYQNRETKINQIRGLCIDTFKSHSQDSCNLGIEYAKENDDYELYEFYNVQKMEMNLKNSKLKNKIPLWFLKHSIGYGFKPLKAFLFSILNILLFAIIYLTNDLISGNIILYRPQSISDIVESIEIMLIYIYQSGITYTTIGFEDLLLINPLIGLIYVLEAMLGVSVLSLMVVSLTRKYFFGKY